MKQVSRPYKIVVPAKLPLERLESWGEKYVEIAKNTNAELFIITRNVFGDKARFLQEMDELRQKVQFFAKRGVSVGAWLCPTTGHEGMGLIVGEEGEKAEGIRSSGGLGPERRLLPLLPAGQRGGNLLSGRQLGTL